MPSGSMYRQVGSSAPWINNLIFCIKIAFVQPVQVSIVITAYLHNANLYCVDFIFFLLLGSLGQPAYKMSYNHLKCTYVVV